LCLLGLPLLFAMGCSEDRGAVRADAPTPLPGKAETACRALRAALPDRVMEDGRREMSPESEWTAAWGDPAIVLRCGVGLPPSMRVSDPDEIDPELVNEVTVNDVRWAFEKIDGGVRFTTVYREANVEVVVPKKFAEPAAPLVDVADAVLRAVPATLGDGEE